MSGRSSLAERIEKIKKKAKKSAKKLKDTIEGGDPNDVADEMGGQLSKTRDAIRDRQRRIDEAVDGS